MPVIRKALRPEEVYPTNLRYNPDTDSVQSLVNGEWVDNPLADPRKQTTLPPRLTSNPACDAAESVKDAFKKQVDDTCEAIDASQTVFTIAAIILAVLSFGFFGIFIGLVLTLVHELIDIGTEAIQESLTPTVWHTFTCILFCHMDASGRLREGGFAALYPAVDDKIGGLGALIIKKMMDLAGEGGINNLASIGTSTGFCDDCNCLCAHLWDFVATASYTGVTIIWGTEELGSGIRVNSVQPPYNDLYAKVLFEFGEPCNARYWDIWFAIPNGFCRFYVYRALSKDGTGEYVWTAAGVIDGSGTNHTGANIFTPDSDPVPSLAMRIDVWDGGYQVGNDFIQKVELRNET